MWLVSLVAQSMLSRHFWQLFWIGILDFRIQILQMSSPHWVSVGLLLNTHIFLCQVETHSEGPQSTHWLVSVGWMWYEWAQTDQCWFIVGPVSKTLYIGTCTYLYLSTFFRVLPLYLSFKNVIVLVPKYITKYLVLEDKYIASTSRFVQKYIYTIIYFYSYSVQYVL